MQNLIKCKVTPLGLFYNFRIAKEERKCDHEVKCDLVISAGERYLRVYKNAAFQIKGVVRICKEHYGICEFCGTIYLYTDGATRFCSQGHAAQHLERAELDHQENMWYGKESGW